MGALLLWFGVCGNEIYSARRSSKGLWDSYSHFPQSWLVLSSLSLEAQLTQGNLGDEDKIYTLSPLYSGKVESPTRQLAVRGKEGAFRSRNKGINLHKGWSLNKTSPRVQFHSNHT